MNIPLGIIAATLLVAFLFCLRGFRTMTLEQWSVGGRGFGTVFVFLLLAGEIYTTFTFLGGSGWAYGRGAPAFYIITYGTIAYIMSYWLLPAIWNRGTHWKVLSQPEFFERAYNSPALGKLVAIVSIAALIPYLVLQLKGLGIIVSEVSDGAITSNVAIWIGTSATVIYVVLAGIKGSALNAALKDILVLVAVVGLGIALPLHHFGGIGPMFDRVIEAKPTFLLLPESGQSKSWFVSTVALTAMGFYMWPHTFGSIFSAKNAQVFRRNAALMPLYQLILLFVFFIGFAALLTVPGLTGSDVDLSLLRIVRATYGPWIVGFVGAAGLLTALVPGSMILMSSATMLSRLFKGDGASSPADSLRLARMFVPAVAAVALVFTFYGGGTLVAMLLMGYSMVTQLFPALVMALWKGHAVSAGSAIAGIIVGELTVAAMTLSKSTLATLLPQFPHAITDLNVGVVAMVLNVATMALVHLVVRSGRDRITQPVLQQ
ncbi:MAG: sodium:solute symporter [Phycisphaerae bacterium]|nr:sodium:solute symporter [Gemmatimonadaceae bacterium]